METFTVRFTISRNVSNLVRKGVALRQYDGDDDNKVFVPRAPIF